MKKEFLYKLIIVLLLLLNGTLLFFMRSKPIQHVSRRPITEVLEFRGSIKTKIDSLEVEHFKSKDALMRKGCELRQKLFEYVLKDDSNWKERDTILTRITKNQEQMERITAEYFKQIYGLCSAEQKEKLYLEIKHVLMRQGPPPHPPRHD